MLYGRLVKNGKINTAISNSIDHMLTVDKLGKTIKKLLTTLSCTILGIVDPTTYTNLYADRFAIEWVRWILENFTVFLSHVVLNCCHWKNWKIFLAQRYVISQSMLPIFVKQIKTVSAFTHPSQSSYRNSREKCFRVPCSDVWTRLWPHSEPIGRSHGRVTIWWRLVHGQFSPRNMICSESQ